jgi:hypothetical protein
MAPVILQSLGRPEGTVVRALVEVAPVAPAERQPADRPAPKASIVALAPAAMSALIEAQEHLANNAPAGDRSDTTQKIDHILRRLAAQGAASGFSVQMLRVARQQLHDTFA